MRLLDTKTRRLTEFQGIHPDYAILSHTWGEEEVSFQDMQDESKASTMKGYSKIKGACAEALKDEFKYIWIDTCCINKESSSELSEAINSMYAWYQNSQVCYAYLVDVPDEADPGCENSLFTKSRWFTRGWTLQELLAPSSLIFYGRDWKEIGTKASLQEVISVITGVDRSVLLSNHSGEISIAKRMSWASKRETTREEDRAYSLMGIFGINMPTLYGEGGNAFIRLQHEITKLSDDHTIFAWRGPSHGQESGLLAHSPAEFIHSADVMEVDSKQAQTSKYSMTNKGLSISLPLKPVENEKDVFLAILNCQLRNRGPLAIYLKRKEAQYVRVHPERLEIGYLDGTTLTKVYVKEKDPARFNVSHRMQPRAQYTFSIVTSIPPEAEFAISEALPSDFWSTKNGTKLLSMGGSGTSGLLMFRNRTSGEEFAVMLGVHNYIVWTDVVTNFGDETPQSIRDSYYGQKRGGTLWRNVDRK
ncbi:HET-domain-containing protein [Tricholoma matsutake]|nr:HET-domain-containing protein [Tricholoma matsutake 945]